MAKFDKLTADDPTVAPTYDLWNVQDEKKGMLDDLERLSTFRRVEKVRKLVGPELASYTEQVYQTYDWKVPSTIIKKPTKLPAIETPLPGTSYNPTYEDHQVNRSPSLIFVILSSFR